MHPSHLMISKLRTGKLFQIKDENAFQTKMCSNLAKFRTKCIEIQLKNDCFFSIKVQLSTLSENSLGMV